MRVRRGYHLLTAPYLAHAEGRENLHVVVFEVTAKSEVGQRYFDIAAELRSALEKKLWFHFGRTV
jgi:hypothetical protein